MLLLNAAKNDQLLDGLMHQCNTTAFFVCLTTSCNHNCDNLGHVGSVEELLNERSPSGSSAVVDFKCCVESDPAGDGLLHFLSTFSVLLYCTSCHLAVIFISLHICTGSFIVKRSARWQEPSLSPLCHFTVYASRRLYAINKLSPPCNVCNYVSHHAVCAARRWWLCSDKSKLPLLLPFARYIYSMFMCALRYSKRGRTNPDLHHILTLAMQKNDTQYWLWGSVVCFFYFLFLTFGGLLYGTS